MAQGNVQSRPEPTPLITRPATLALKSKHLDADITPEMTVSPSKSRPRPQSPNIQIYRPQITSVLSIFNRITGIFLSICAVLMVISLIAAAGGPETYGVVQGVIASWLGQVFLLGATFAFFLHFCGGIRHLVWDTGLGFELRSIYISGWIVIAASVALTVSAWALSLFLKG